MKKQPTQNPPGTKDNPVLVYNALDSLQFREPDIQQLFLHLSELSFQLQVPGELSIAFLSDKEHTQLHITHHQNPEPTDVITFQGSADYKSAGEICVSPEFAQNYCEENGGNFSRELTLYLIHGWLHLCGLDDQTEEQRLEMRKAEKTALQNLEATNAIPEFKLND